MNNVTPIRIKAPMAEERDANARIDTHEAVCAERYKGISAQLGRLEKWFVAFTGALIGYLAYKGGF
jgi:hypothetical protein